MKRLSLLIYILFLTPFALFSQSLKLVTELPTDLVTSLSENYDLYFWARVLNLSQSDVNVKIKTEVKKITFGHSYDICWDGLCSPPTTENWESITSFKLKPNDTLPNNFFYSHYYAFNKMSDPVEGEGTIKYIFFEEGNTNNSVDIEINFKFVSGNYVLETLGDQEIETIVKDNLMFISSKNHANYNLVFYNLQGNILENHTFQTNKTVDIGKLQKGLILFQILRNNQVVGRGKLLIK